MSIQVNISIDEAALQKIDNLLRTFPGDQLPLMIATKIIQEGALPRARYYPPAPGRPQPFKTAKQRRAFFAMVRNGQIRVPYQRTMALFNGWQQSSDGFSLENNTKYAFLVQGGRNEQAKYHEETGWFTVERIADETMENDAVPLATAAVVEWVSFSIAS